MKYLGIHIGRSSIDLADLNYPVKIKKLQKALNSWLRHGLTPFGGIHSFDKTVALYQLIYRISCWRSLANSN